MKFQSYIQYHQAIIIYVPQRMYYLWWKKLQRLLSFKRFRLLLDCWGLRLFYYLCIQNKAFFSIMQSKTDKGTLLVSKSLPIAN